MDEGSPDARAGLTARAGVPDMAARVRAFDWSRTALGPMERWTAGRRAIVDMLLAHPLPMILLAGPQLVQVYNDGYAHVAGLKHPAALGRPTRETWPEVWHINGPIYERVMTRGESVLLQDQLFPTTRHGRLADAYFTLTYSPVRDGAGAVDGVILTVVETTPTVVAAQDRARREELEAMREEDAEYRSLFESMDEGFLLAEILYDDGQRPVDLLYLAANPAAVRMTGADVVGRTLSELDGSYEHYWIEIWGRVARTGIGERHERYAAPLDRWFDFFVFRVGGDGSRRVAVVFSDATDRKRRDANAAFLAGLADDFSSLAAADEVMQQIGAKIGAYLGVATCSFADVEAPPAEAIVVSHCWGRGDAPSLAGRHRIRDFLAPGLEGAGRAGEPTVVRDTQADPRAGALAALGVHAFVAVPFARDGEWRHVLAVADTAPREWREHEVELVRAIAGVVFPRLERARTASQLRESEERARLLVENARDHAVFTIAVDGRVSSWNPGAARIFGYATAEIVGRLASALFTPEDQSAGQPEQELATAAREGRASDDRWQIRRDGTRFWANGVTSAMRDGAGHLRGFTKVLRDMTEAKRAEEERERLLEQERIARAQAERATLMKDEFLAVVSHELRTPLAAILIWTRLLRDGGMSAPEQRQAIETIEQSAGAQRQLIEDLLDISRMTAGQLALDVRDVELEAVVRAAVETVRPMAEARQVDVAIDAGPGVGLVRVDPGRIQQVVWNLVSNAVKFTDAGGSVRLRLRRLDGRAELEVRDTGRGITAEFLPHAFDRFRQQEPSTTRTAGGLGLGLAIARQIVELHGGEIRAESAGAGRGSTFTVELPQPASPA